MNPTMLLLVTASVEAFGGALRGFVINSTEASYDTPHCETDLECNQWCWEKAVHTVNSYSEYSNVAYIDLGCTPIKK